VNFNNDFAQPPHDPELALEVGFFANSNKHLVLSQAHQVQVAQKASIKKIYDQVRLFGTLDGNLITPKLHKKFISFAKVC
jgi:hypothetical protein